MASDENSNSLTSQHLTDQVHKPKWLNPDRCDSTGASRPNRTTKLTGIKGTVYTRDQFVDRVKETVGESSLEAVGPTNAIHIWQLVFKTTDDKDKFEAAGDFQINDSPITIWKPYTRQRLQRTKQTVFHCRLHWIPYYVQMSAAVTELEKIPDLHVVSCQYETMSTPGREHIRTTVREVTIETENVDSIPYYIKWTYLGYSGKALLTCKGRAPKCLKCQLTGHLKRDCTMEQCNICKQWGHNDPNCNIKISWAKKITPVETVDMESELHEGDEEVATSSAPALAASETPIKLTCLDEGVAIPGETTSTPTAVSLANSSNAAAVAEAVKDSADMSAEEVSAEQWQAPKGRKRSRKTKQAKVKDDTVTEPQSPNNKLARKLRQDRGQSAPKQVASASESVGSSERASTPLCIESLVKRPLDEDLVIGTDVSNITNNISVVNTTDTVSKLQGASVVTPQNDVILEASDSVTRAVTANNNQEPSAPCTSQDLSITESCFQSEDDDVEEEIILSMVSESSDSDSFPLPASTPVRSRRHRSHKRSLEEENGRDRSHSRSRSSSSEAEKLKKPSSNINITKLKPN